MKEKERDTDIENGCVQERERKKKKNRMCACMWPRYMCARDKKNVCVCKRRENARVCARCEREGVSWRERERKKERVAVGISGRNVSPFSPLLSGIFCN
jgi:hypothetical protein